MSLSDNWLPGTSQVGDAIYERYSLFCQAHPHFETYECEQQWALYQQFKLEEQQLERQEQKTKCRKCNMMEDILRSECECCGEKPYCKNCVVFCDDKKHKKEFLCYWCSDKGCAFTGNGRGSWENA